MRQRGVPLFSACVGSGPFFAERAIDKPALFDHLGFHHYDDRTQAVGGCIAAESLLKKGFYFVRSAA